jgi:hypothetical protein
MLIGAASEVCGDTGVERAVGTVRHDVDPAATHWAMVRQVAAAAKTWMAGTSPAMTSEPRRFGRHSHREDR